MTPATRELFDAAVAAQTNAHCPYSNYPVGAAVRTSSGAIFAGCNVENAAYPNGTCAEAGAIAAMVAAGERSIVEVVTVTGGQDPGTPCGGCRQRIREFAEPDTLVHATTRGIDATNTTDPTSATVLTLSITDLLPESFGPEQLPSAEP
jgi:cytidine deaminase